MSKERHNHWLTPTTSLLSFTCGVALAIIHHIFYSSLNNTAVNADVYNFAGFRVSQQQINTATGTTLAFLSRACFLVTLSSAYTQHFWLLVGRNGRRTRVKTLDVMYGALDNVWNLCRVGVWWKRPVLLLTGVVSWLLPIAFVITPATLSVVVAPVSPLQSDLLHVPQADFSSLKFLAPGQSNSFVGGPADPNTLIYNGPTFTAQWIALAAAVSGSISSIPARSPNASYTLYFHGPSLRCGDLNSTMRDRMQQNILRAYRVGSGCQQPYNFMAWTPATGNPVPGLSSSNSNPDPFANHDVPFPTKTPFTMNAGTVGPLDYSVIGPNGTTNATQVATIYFAAIPNFKYKEIGGCTTSLTATNERANAKLAYMFDNSTLLQCQLYNASYTATFTYTNGAQDIRISQEPLNPVDTLAGFYMPLRNASESCSAFNANYQSCTIDPVTLQRLSYQSIMDAFGRIFVGTVLDGQQSKYGGSYVTKTNVLSTTLLSTKELAFLRAPSNWANADVGVFSNVSKDLQSLYDWTPDQANASLKDTLEEMFQNITLSMFSSAHLQPNTSSPFAPSRVNVTRHEYHNVYAYAVVKLWLAYGIAIGFTLLGLCTGLVAMLFNGASFSREFSAVLRAARFADVGVEIRAADGDGKDPLPKYMEDAEVAFEGGIWNRNTSQSPDDGQEVVSRAKGGFRLFQRSS
ncbi:hypothetical protein M409DRAFT_26958 [Zasmidium cellare ATCC 36951]|uniref:Uncharacterized protein n=1 Tax=Zasmidium cellare ATCC 36951 TaxID=1080233 RepID=A0A6A6C6P7_ZASCE|nr:uncharacterized protein M409DRAFT_26958 [Zasmidium cellare ATCC 36951]KAF2162721.1 hypothetical protein M409DRAFT_26958 [Zasmidium cellare ATCC 36951]